MLSSEFFLESVEETKFQITYFTVLVLWGIYYFSFIFPLAIGSPCRKKNKADTNSTLFAPKEKCTKTYAAEKRDTVRAENS